MSNYLISSLRKSLTGGLSLTGGFFDLGFFFGEYLISTVSSKAVESDLKNFFLRTQYGHGSNLTIALSSGADCISSLQLDNAIHKESRW